MRDSVILMNHRLVSLTHTTHSSSHNPQLIPRLETISLFTHLRPSPGQSGPQCCTWMWSCIVRGRSRTSISRQAGGTSWRICSHHWILRVLASLSIHVHLLQLHCFRMITTSIPLVLRRLAEPELFVSQNTDTFSPPPRAPSSHFSAMINATLVKNACPVSITLYD